VARRYRERVMTADELAKAFAKRLHVVCKAGPLRSGAQRGHGTIWHLAPGPDADHDYWKADKALCGAAPSISWSQWHHKTDPTPTCPKCRRLAEKEQTRLGAIGLVDRADDLRLVLRSNGN
jgi:hypothetical protein